MELHPSTDKHLMKRGRLFKRAFLNGVSPLKQEDAFTLGCYHAGAVLWVGSDGCVIGFGVFEGRVEHMTRSRQVAGHPTSIFFCWMKPRKMKGKNGKTSLIAFP
jgi:hypothetical protein